MRARIDDPQLQDAYATLRGAGARGRELAETLDRRRTRVRAWKRVPGGLTLNFLNLIALQPLPANADETEYRWWVTLLAHEAAHIQQGYWVDSVQQEIRAYAAQWQVARELGIDLGPAYALLAQFDPASAEQRAAARAALVSLFGGQPAALVYAALPLLQPTGWRAIVPGIRETLALLRAGLTRGAR